MDVFCSALINSEKTPIFGVRCFEKSLLIFSFGLLKNSGEKEKYWHF